ncbi:MAG: caspase family protein [Campylobacterales bacterium]|nr:caspase family protein [Campylobacterales bacterium]
MGDSIKLNHRTIKYDGATITIIDKNKNIIARMIKDEMKKYNNSDGMTLLQDGYFTGGKSVPVSTSMDLKSIPIFQLYDHFFRPDLVKLKLDGNEKEYQNATKRMSYAEALKNPPPTIQFKNKKLITDKNKLTIPFVITDNQGGVGVIRIYQEGKLIQTIGDGNISRVSANLDAIIEQNRLDSLNQTNQKNLVAFLSKAISVNQSVAKSKSNNTITNRAGKYSVEIDLVSGNNEIAIEAFNKTNTVASFRETMSIEANIPKKEPKLYAIVIGIDDFEEINQTLHLNYAQKDALMLKEAIEKSSNKSFSDIEIKHLEGKQVIKATIFKTIQTIREKAKLEDTIIFYISTHGRAIHGDLYLVPYNNGDSRNWLEFAQLFNAVQSIKALNQIFIVDACESGQANDIVSSVYDSRASVLAKSAGVHMLLATTKGATAYEPKKGSNKVNTFTQRILRAIEDKTTDTNNDNMISIVELSNKLKSNMNEVKYQYPIIRSVGSDVQLLRTK